MLVCVSYISVKNYRWQITCPFISQCLLVCHNLIRRNPEQPTHKPLWMAFLENIFGFLLACLSSELICIILANMVLLLSNSFSAHSILLQIPQSSWPYKVWQAVVYSWGWQIPSYSLWMCFVSVGGGTPASKGPYFFYVVDGGNPLLSHILIFSIICNFENFRLSLQKITS